jgi:simple sugar transport system permease protein
MSISLPNLRESWVYTVFSSQVWGVPVQIFWALLFVVFSIFLFNRHRFGARVRCVGDNPESAAQMGINTRRVRVMTLSSWAWGRAWPASSPP